MHVALHFTSLARRYTPLFLTQMTIKAFTHPTIALARTRLTLEHVLEDAARCMLELIVVIWTAEGCAEALEVVVVTWFLGLKSGVVDCPFGLGGWRQGSVEAVGGFV
jgi:hypothetical protein